MQRDYRRLCWSKKEQRQKSWNGEYIFGVCSWTAHERKTDEWFSGAPNRKSAQVTRSWSRMGICCPRRLQGGHWNTWWLWCWRMLFCYDTRTIPNGSQTYPIQKKALSTEYLRDNAYLRARTGHIAAMLRLRDQVSRSLTQFFEVCLSNLTLIYWLTFEKSQGFTYTHTPIITGNDCEGAGEAFRIAPLLSPTSDPLACPLEFFSRAAYLTVSHQLHLESFTAALSRVYTLSPCFCAERSMTGRHLAEFWMLEAEWNLATRFDNIEEICTFLESLIRSSVDLDSPEITKLWSERDGGGLQSKDYQMFRSALDNVQPWSRITYTEAIELLKAAHAKGRCFEYEPKWGESLSSEHERGWQRHMLVGQYLLQITP